ncbi:MAG TPA: ABC-F family ATPase [Gammaproteobacteria bacterium]|nr:ABC-F family ATPase [Gammaproteobacteria bacterium]
MISVANLTVQFGEKPLFEDVSVKFGDGHRYGLIGANGSGKTTLMRVLGGELEPTHGNVSIPAHARVGKLRQDQFAFENLSVIHTVIMGHERLWKVFQERERLYSHPTMSEAEGLHAAELENEFAQLDGYTAESAAGELLLAVGIPESQHYGPMSAVAPGWKLRVLLAQALFANPDVMLLDEPTNNLDIDTIRWLEGVLNERKCTMIIISHDRHFLNTVCTHMADLDYGELRVFPGNYDEYMIAATQARERVSVENAKKKVQIADLQAFVSRFSANASKSRQATSRARQIEKIVLEEVKPSSRMSPYIKFEQDKKLHRLAVSVNKLSKSYGPAEVFRNVSLGVEAGQRVAIVGTNGIGKTTLLRCIMRELELNHGTVKWAENADVAYMPQDNAGAFEEPVTVFDWMRARGKPRDDDQAIRATLGRLLFSRDEMGKTVDKLSGGERGRMLFGEIMLRRPNIIIMDEPTNHLDMESIESLNLALDNYPGTLIFVSHDREFVSSLATRIIELTPKGIVDFSGNYDDYLRGRGIAIDLRRAASQ